MNTKLILLLIAAITVVYLLAVAVDATPALRGPAPMDVEWRWRRYQDPPYRRAWPLLLVLLLTLGLVAWMERLDVDGLSPWRRRALLLAILVAALLIQASTLYLARSDVVTLLFERNVSRSSDGYYTAVLGADDLGVFLDTFAERMPTFPGDHPRTHPPGFPLIHWAIRETVGRWPALRTWVRWHACPTLRVHGLSAGEVTSALVVGVLTPLVSVLAILPVHALARQRGNVRDGLRAAALLALVPAFHLFSPQVDQLYPLLTALIVWAFDRGWQQRRSLWFLASGLLLSLATFLSLGLVTLGLWLGTYALVRWLTEPPESRLAWRRLAVAGLFLGLGAACIWLFGWVAFGLDPLAVYRTGVAQHYEVVTAGRRYALWVWYNLYDYAAFLGLPLAILFAIRTFTSARSAVRRERERVDAVAIATALTILVITLSGTSRGEVARMWLFLAPPIILAAVSAVKNAGRRWFVWLASLQAASLLVFALYLDVVPVLPLEALARTRQIGPTAARQGEAITFGEQIELLGYEAAPQPARPGQDLNLTFRWRALHEPQCSYKVFVHLLDAAGDQRAQVDGVPLNWALPTTCWVEGEVIVDAYALPLPGDLPPGEYTPAVGFYDESTRERLRVLTMYPLTGKGTALPILLGDRLELDPVRVEAPP